MSKSSVNAGSGLLALCLAAGVAACSNNRVSQAATLNTATPNSPPLVITGASEAPRAASEMRFVLTNPTASPIYRDECETVIESRLDADNWEPVQVRTCRPNGTGLWHRIDAGSSVTYDAPIEWLRAGEYRLVVGVQYATARSQVQKRLVSQPFRIY